ncbi:MAG: VWA domain-containing protein [Fimbriimonas sp.]|nr:VWA domain-containing protein [Fimbriimonas sp.]
MNQQTTQLPGLEAVVTTHRDEHRGLLLANLKALDAKDRPPRAPMKVALVIDRSGSMAGDQLEITKLAVAKFIRSLDADDQVAIVTYDHKIDLVSGLTEPSEMLASSVESIQAGGSTDLYGGWVMGAKIVGKGGRVILLSDGQANAGRFQDGPTLAQHAALSYEQYGVTTTTVGVGLDYDEGLMAGMARSGGGAHYFAHTADAIIDAFSLERYSVASVVLASVSLRCNGVTEQMGHFWSGETKNRVFAVVDLAGTTLSVRYLEKATGQTYTEFLTMPSEFGYSEDVKLEYLLQQAGEAEGEMLRVRDPRSATEMRERLRGIVLALLSHPSSDEPAVAAVVDRLRASIQRLERLERNYVEEEAVMHRKRSMQSSYNLREGAKAFSSFKDELEMSEVARRSLEAIIDELLPTVDTKALALAPVDRWIQWEAIPVNVTDNEIFVEMEDPRRGFVLSEIEKATHRKVTSTFCNVKRAQIVEILKAHV